MVSVAGDMASPVWVSFEPPRRQRRLTVFFRAILVIPQWIALTFVGIAGFVALVIGWFAALLTGRLPAGIAAFLEGLLRWQVRFHAYGLLLVDVYPPFSTSRVPYPADLSVKSGRLNRWSVLFRFILALPAGLAAGLLACGMVVFSVVGWVVTLVTGELPDTFHRANAAAIRYLARYTGFFWMLTSVYPDAVLGDGRPPARFAPDAPSTVGPAPDGVFFELGSAQPPASPLPAPTAPAVPLDAWCVSLTDAARRLVIAFFVIGVVVWVGSFAVPIALGGSVANDAEAIAAQNEAVSAYDGVTSAADASKSSIESCNAQVTCVEAADATLAAALNGYRQNLASINYPSSVSSKAVAAEAAAARAAAAFTEVSKAGPTASDYEAVVGSSQLESAAKQVDTTFQALDDALLRS